MQYRNTCAEMLYLCILYLRWKHARVSMDFSMASSSANLLTANNGRRESANRVAMTLGKSSQARFSMVKCEWASGVREEADASVEYNEYKNYICGGDTSIYYIITVRRCMWSSSSSLPGHHTVHGVMSAKRRRTSYNQVHSSDHNVFLCPQICSAYQRIIITRYGRFFEWPSIGRDITRMMAGDGCR